MSRSSRILHPTLLPATILGIILLVVGGSARPVAQVFSVDPTSPLATAPGGSPANLYAPGPLLYCQAGAIGLLSDDDIDALSFGFDAIGSPVTSFSTGPLATGALVAGNAICSEAGTCAPAAPCAPETAGDVYATDGLGTAVLLFDGDGSSGTAPGLGLTECPSGGPGTQDNLDAFDDLSAPIVAGAPAWPVYFSLAAGSPTLAGQNPLLPGGASPADILVFDPGHDSLSVFLTARSLGLVSNDDLDGLALDVIGGDALLSLAPGSPSLAAAAGICPGGCTPGDFIRAPGLICGLLPCLAGGLGFSDAGLASQDNVQAMDKDGSPPAFAFDDTSPGRTYSVDSTSPVLQAIRASHPPRKGSGADLLTQDPKNPNGAPRVVYTAESLGLLPGDEIDGVSFGREQVFVPGADSAVEFSVNRVAVGAVGTAVFRESSSPDGAEASSDVFESFFPAGGPPPSGNRQGWDGNGSSAPTLQLREIHLGTQPDGDDLDALEGPPQTVDPDDDGVRDLPVYFSLAPGSPTLAGANPLLPGGAAPGDILVSSAPFAAPSVFIGVGDGSMGLGPADNLQDFALQAASGNVDFTLPAGPAGALGGAPGTIFKRAGFAPCLGSPCAVSQPGDVGLLSTDDMNALDTLTPVRVCVAIQSGADPMIDVTHGACGLSLPAGPYDMIEGELEELTENPQGVSLSRTACRADARLANRITLDGGIDPFTRIRFILVRNDGDSEYGFSSRGNPRVPESGDCP